MSKTKQKGSKIIAAALGELNVIRALLGMEKLKRMPKGEVFDGSSCPVANGFGKGLSAEVDEIRISVYHDDQSIRFSTPPAIARFVKAFDSGRIPQLQQT